MQGAAVQPAAPVVFVGFLSGLAIFVWMSRDRNNISENVLVSDQAGSATRRRIKRQEDEMPTLASNLSRASFIAVAAAFAVLAAQPAQAQSADTSFFLTSAPASAMAATSAVSPAPTITVRPWRRPPAPTLPG
jgi:hypothetical protein